MSDNLEAWKTQKESKHAVHHAESPFGGGTVAGRKEMEEHRMSDSLSEKARRDLVQAKMAALAQSIIDSEREYFIITLWQLNLTQEERADLLKLLREQGIVHLLPAGEENVGSREGGATYMAIRRYHIIPGTGEEFLHRVQAGFVPIISRMPGFIAYDALQIGNDQIVSISVFNTPVGVIESTPRALQWIQENIAGLIQGMPEVMAGQVGASSELSRVYGKARRKLFR
jgi:antibiotic biosynthesis monooxygenase